jgi:O-antigen ligase
MNTRTDSGVIFMQWLVIFAIAGTSLVFVVNVNDSAMLKRPILYVTTGLLSAAWVSHSIRRMKIDRTFTSIDLAFLIYVALAALSLFKAPNLSLGAIGIADLVSYMILFSVSTQLFRDQGFSQRILKALIVLSILACIVALFQVLSAGGPPSPYKAQDRETISTFGNVTFFAGFLAPMMALISAQILANKRLVNRLPLVLLLALMIYLLVSTESRSAWAGAAAGVLLLTFLNVRPVRTRWIALGALLAVGIVVYIMFPGMVQRRFFATMEMSPTSSIARRFFFYRGAWNAFLSSPLIGHGIGNFIAFLPEFRSPDYWMARSEDLVPHAHNEYLEIVSETGIAGFFGFATIVILAVRSAVTRFKQLEERDRILLGGLLCAIAAILIDNLASLNLRTIPVALLFWILLARARQQSTTEAHPLPIALPRWVNRAHLLPYILFGALMIWYVPRVTEHYYAQKYYLAANLLRSQQKATESLEMYKEAVSHDPGLADARLYLAANLAQGGHSEEARRHIDTILMTNPYYPKARFILAIADFELGDTMHAVKAMTDELRLETSPQAVYYASVFRRKMNQPDSEYVYLKRLLNNSIRSGSSEFAEEGIERLAAWSKLANTRGESISLVAGVRRTFPRDVRLLLSIEEFYEHAGLVQEAKSCLEEAAALDPGNADIGTRLSRLKEGRQ